MSLVTITQTTPQPPLQIQEGDVVTFRAWYTNSFVASDGLTPVEGGDGQSGFYYEETCTINDDGFPVIPALEVQPTTESNPTAGFFGALFVNGAFNRMVFGNTNASAGWQIPTSPTTTTFGLLALYNAAVQLLYPPLTFPTFEQVRELISMLAGNQQFAAVGIAGITELDTAPDDPNRPIAVGVNSGVFGNLNGTLTLFAVPRASSDRSLTDGLATDDGTDWGVQTLNYVQLGDYQDNQNSSFISVNDNFGQANIFSGSDAGAQYAGLNAACGAGSAQIYIQST